MIGKTGRRAEAKAAKRSGMRLTPASGAGSSKGDAQDDQWLVENKSTVKRSLGLRHEWLGKITREAAAKALTPALSIQFTTEDGKPVRNGAWVCIPESAWLELKEHLDADLD